MTDQGDYKRGEGVGVLDLWGMAQDQRQPVEHVGAKKVVSGKGTGGEKIGKSGLTRFPN